MEVISKNKPKGKEYSVIKAKRKQKRILEEKAIKQRTENRRQNAEKRKAQNLEAAYQDKCREVEIVGVRKNMLLLNIEGEIEKRAPLYDKKKVRKDNLDTEILNIFVKLYGSDFPIRKLKNFKEKREELVFSLEELFD
ncbi:MULTISPECIES: hypothetical protein [Fusobacterium]|uniref:hypothetical protein n=1 Tax=Fusobacterium TaxID=848 RepID=UPI0004834007|nr:MULTISPECIES: hypothetical protein [Fusobacterium]MCI6152736.1 hypothetical protein [Fusobacterium perfoetens]MDY3236630.1 hypothetical protein [Fusobacterium perfoetens]NME36145.1 hypothetical protein [Fusobacterium sp. FSA-380-WT-3A]